MDYEDINYDQPIKEKFCQNFVFSEYNAASAIKWAIKGTSQNVLHDEVGSESPIKQVPDKKQQNKSLRNYIEIILKEISHYIPRNNDDFRACFRIEFFKNTILYKINEWNHLNIQTRNSKL